MQLPDTLFYNNMVAGNRAMYESSGAASTTRRSTRTTSLLTTRRRQLHMYDLNSAFYAELSHNNFYSNSPRPRRGWS